MNCFCKNVVVLKVHTINMNGQIRRCSEKTLNTYSFTFNTA